MRTPPAVTLYTRAGCHLCEQAERVIEAARRRVAFTLEVIDIDRDGSLRRQYNEEVPVVAINGKKSFKYHVDEQEFLKKLAART